MNAALLRGIGAVPADIDLVVGVPRSGLLAGSMLGLALNLPFTDLEGFCAGRIFSHGMSRGHRGTGATPRKVLVLDDSVRSGRSIRHAREMIAQSGFDGEAVYAAVYGVGGDEAFVDFVFEVVPLPRVFQWNVMHHGFTRRACFALDGVICDDPDRRRVDGEDAYRDAIATARPRFLPSGPIGPIVTGRAEAYRAPTEAWLRQWGVSYERLVMLGPSGDRAQRRAAARLKADVYRDADAYLFFEGDRQQAFRIAQRAGKAVICTDTFELIKPSLLTVPHADGGRTLMSPAAVVGRGRRAAIRMASRLAGAARRAEPRS